VLVVDKWIESPPAMTVTYDGI